MKYFINSLVDFRKTKFEISKEEFDQYDMARETVNECTKIHEIFFHAAESFEALEAAYWRISHNFLMYGHLRSIDVYKVSYEYSKYIFSFLSATRLYLDTIDKGVSRIPRAEVTAKQIAAFRSEQYDKSYSYRIMEQIRNHSQHRGLPTTRFKFSSKRDVEKNQTLHGVKFIFELMHAKKDKWRPEVYRELEAGGGTVDLHVAAREYFLCLCEINKNVLNITGRCLNEAHNCLSGARELWESKFPDVPSALLVSERQSGSENEVDNHRVYLYVEFDDYSKYLHEKIKRVDGIGKRSLMNILE